MRNELARDSYSFIHFPMVAGIILFALGLKKTLGHVDDPLDAVPAFALLGGVAIYLMGLVAFRYRHVHTLNRRRLGLAVALFALIARRARDGRPRHPRHPRRADLGGDRGRDPRLRRGPLQGAPRRGIPRRALTGSCPLFRATACLESR